MSFDRTGNCPICHRHFQSEDCPHTWDYVHKVLEASKSDFVKDVIRMKMGKASHILTYK